MNVQIETAHDSRSGLTLLIRFPLSELDSTALYTLQTDQPNFLVPFHSRNINGQAEFMYRVDGLIRLKDNPIEDCEAAEYLQFWEQILSPMVDCDDWFMDLYSFVLDSEYLYTDMNRTAVKYLYVPSVSSCCDENDRRQMTRELFRQNSSRDKGFDNQIRDLINQNLPPDRLLKSIRRAGSEIDGRGQGTKFPSNWLPSGKGGTIIVEPVPVGGNGKERIKKRKG